MFETIYHIPLNYNLHNFYFNGDSDESWCKCVLEHLQSKFHRVVHCYETFFTFKIYNITNDTIMLKVTAESIEDEDAIPNDVFEYIEDRIITEMIPYINSLLLELPFITLPKNAPFYFEDNKIWVLISHCTDMIEPVNIVCKEELDD